MERSLRQSRILFLLIPLLAGCKYDRSFMQMDSNSGSPFFGLQFAVDSGSRPPRTDSETTVPSEPLRMKRHGVEPLSAPRPDEDTSPPRMTLVSQNDDAAGTSFEHTSRTAPFNGRIRYSIPQENNGHRSIAEGVDLHRAAF